MTELLLTNSLSPSEIWRLNHRSSTNWGLSGYEIPKKYFDHRDDQGYLKLSKEDTKSRKSVPSRRRDFKSRGDFLEKQLKINSSLPAPWTYDTFPAEGIGSAATTSLKGKKLKILWRNIPEKYINSISSVQKQVHHISNSVKKNTYIDKIIADNSKEGYPLPGPCNYFMDEKTIKNFYPENIALFNLNSKKESENGIFTYFNKKRAKKNDFFSAADKCCTHSCTW